MSSYQYIKFEISKNIGTVWLNRPEVHNALNPEMISEIIDCFFQINELKKLRVVILRGTGKSFCAGADLNYMQAIASYGFEQNFNDGKLLANCFNTIYNCKKPTIALVHGAAIGGANGLLAACDFVFCTNETKFAFSEVKLGIAPATIAPYVIKRIGEFGARDLMLTGRRINGIEAEKFNLVNKSVLEEELEGMMNETIMHLLTSGPESITSCKELIRTIENDLNFEDSKDYTAKLIANLRASTEGQEGMCSFLEKRKPGWAEDIMV